ncbi:hypothetical protein V8C34DRAFT_325866 [Trichoderma compactum]
MASPDTDTEVVKEEDLYQIDEALSELFDKVLEVLAGTDLFGREASIFIVYAHDNDATGNAGAQCVRYLIKWLLAMRSRVLSDKSPLRSRREGGFSAAENIFSNQLCILPRGSITSDEKEEITSVDKVVLCGSKVLQQYWEHSFTASYIDDIVKYYTKSRDMQPKDIQDGIRRIVEDQCQSDGFHHVLTELALLKLRRSADSKGNGGIIPIALNGDGMGYLPFMDHCALFLKPDHSQSHALQHKLFFRLIRQLYLDSGACSVIDTFNQCYTDASERLGKEKAITQKILREITYEEIYKAQAIVLKSRTADIRDENWASKWKKTTESALSQRDEIINWLPKFHDATDTHRYNLQQRQGQTGTWMLRDEKYEQWKRWKPTDSSESAEQLGASRLWCNGNPGAGKTIISSVIIEDLEKHIQNDIVEPLVGIAYVFCKHREHQTASTLMLSLVAQLAHQRHQLSTKVLTIASRYKDRKSPAAPDLVECGEMLKAEVRQFNKVFIVVDALDERLDHDHAYQLLGILLKTKANMLITSRDVGSIGDIYVNAVSIEITAQPGDVEAYLKFRLEQPEASTLKTIMGDGNMSPIDIVKTLVPKAHGMFLLPRMHMDLAIAETKRYPTLDSLKAAIDNLPTELNTMYDEYIQRILQSDSAEHAKDVLAWVLFAREPIRLKVIQEAISLQKHCDRIDDLIPPGYLLGYCIGLLAEKGPSRESVSFVHPDMERYFRHPKTSDKIKGWLPNGNQRIAISCLRCLLLLDGTEAQAESPLWSYAAKYWGHHIQDQYNDMELQPLILEYLSQTDEVTCAMQYSMQQPGLTLRPELSEFGQVNFDYLCQHPIPSTCHGWHVAAFFGIQQHFCTAKQDAIGCKDSNGWTPLWWAILGGQDAMVELLLNKGAETNTKSLRNIPLAVWMLGVDDEIHSDFTIKNVILEGQLKSGNVYVWQNEISCFNAMQRLGPRTLRIATQKSTSEVLKRLDSRGLNARDANGNSVLLTAAKLWQCDVVQQLIDRGADRSLRNNSGATAFTQALKRWGGDWYIESLQMNGEGRAMIGSHVYISAQTTLDPYSFGWLEATIEKMLVKLIPRDLDVNSEEVRLALCLAVNNRHSLVVEKLLEKGADVNARSEDGFTLLGLACRRPVTDRFHVSNLLLKDDAKLQVGTFATTKELGGIGEEVYIPKIRSTTKRLSRGNIDGRPASPTGFDSIVRMLLNKGADIHAEIHGQTALELAARNEYLTIFRTLLAAGADITRVDRLIIKQLQRLLGPDGACEGLYTKDGACRALHTKDGACKGLYEQAGIGTLQDFETHDYCILLLNFVIPQSFITGQDVVTTGDSTVHFGDIFENAFHLRLSSGENAKESLNVQKKWNPRKEALSTRQKQGGESAREKNSGHLEVWGHNPPL